MRENIDISFIIPVYNGETTILRCVKSVQEYEGNIEIIIVNDGSTDGTEKICNELKASDKKIKLITISNGGQSKARNTGLELAKGKYIGFVDADDYINPKNMKYMWEKACKVNSDVIMGSYIRNLDSKSEEICLPGEGRISRNINTVESHLYHKVKTSSAFGYVWNKLYKKSFLQEHKLKMDDIRKVYMEDTLFNLKVWSKNPIWYCIDKPVYYYEVSNVSTTRRAETEIHVKNVTMIKEILSYFQSENCLDENIDTVVPLIMRTFCWSLVKNIVYEGNSIEKIKLRAMYYMNQKEIQEILKKRGAFKSLFMLPSLLQSIFYSLCFLLIRYRMVTIVTILFTVLYPILNIYIRITLK